jgi:hypothetical protein
MTWHTICPHDLAKDRHVPHLVRYGTATLLVATVISATTAAADPFAWLQVGSFDSAARVQVERGGVSVNVLPAVDAEVGILAVSQVDADGETLAAWANSIDQLKKGPYVLAIHRFSDPPTLEDVRAMQLDDGDLNDIRRCTPGECDVKMAAAEIISLRQAANGGGSNWKDTVQQRFRELVLQRVVAYGAHGVSTLPAYADRRRPIDAQAAISAIVDRSSFLTSDLFTGADAESFFYWSKEQYGTGKPVIGVTHVEIIRPTVESALRVAVVSREILATHYRNASVGMTAVSEDGRGHRFLIYINRSQLDVLGGFFGAWKRAIVEGRLKSDSAGVFTEVRRRLESGLPPE